MKSLLSAALCLALCSAQIAATNNKLKDVFSWKYVDYAWSAPEQRASAIEKGEFVPKNNLPLGLEVWKEKLFITVPRWKNGVVSTLNYVQLNQDAVCEPPPPDPTTPPPPDPPTTTPPPPPPPPEPDTIFPPADEDALTTAPPFSIDDVTAPAPAGPVTVPAPLGRFRRSRSLETEEDKEKDKKKRKKRKKAEVETVKPKKSKKKDEKAEPIAKPPKKHKKGKKEKPGKKDKKKEKKKKKKKKPKPKPKPKPDDDDCSDECDDCSDECDDCSDECDDCSDECDDCSDECDDCDDEEPPAPTTAEPPATPEPCVARSPPLIPYPSFEANRVARDANDTTTPIVSVFRVRADACDRLWVMDTGIADILGDTQVVSKPRILIYNLNDDSLIRTYELKDTDSKQDSFYANIVVDAVADNCDNAFAYIPDLGGYGIVVYDYAKNDSWRVKHNYFHFDPLSGDMTVGGVNFQWTDGVFSIALGKPKDDGSRTAFFHALASTKEFKVDTKTLQNPDPEKRSYFDYKIVGDRGANSQSSASFIDEDTGVMFYTQLQKDGVYCWNTNKELVPENLVEIASDNETMIFTNDLKVDPKGNLWVLTDRLPAFIYKGLEENEVNYHIFMGSAKEVIEGSNCAP